MEKYIKPSLKVKKVDVEEMLAASPGDVNPSNPTSGLPGGTPQPGNGGDNDGTHPVGAKSSFWDNSEE